MGVKAVEMAVSCKMISGWCQLKGHATSYSLLTEDVNNIFFTKFTTVGANVIGVANGKCETLRDHETSVFLCEPETF